MPLRFTPRLAFILLLAGFGSPSLRAQTSAHAQDSLALVDIYLSAGGENWSTTWNLSEPVAEWAGVELNAAGRVFRLRLSSNGLEGELSPSVGELTAIFELRLNDNRLNGAIPDVWEDLVALTLLDMSRNEFTGELPASIYQLTSLERLFLHLNRLEGQLPEAVGGLSNLKVLKLEWNRFSGPMPSAIGQISGLEQLTLYQNLFSGAIPAEWGELTQLSRLQLFSNRISGAIPPELGSLTSLRFLVLSDNDLEGDIPAELGQLTGLRELNVADNFLSGAIPASLANLSQLEVLNLSDNLLTGTVPEWAFALENLQQLAIAGNNLSGTLPTIGSVPALEQLDLAENNLSGGFPDLSGAMSLSLLDLSSNGFSGPIGNSIASLSDLQILNLQQNDFSGGIPSGIMQLERLSEARLSENALSGGAEAFEGLEQLTWLDLSNNNLTGTLPDLSNSPELVSINLSENRFSGALPSYWGAFPQLQTLFLQANDLTGELPAELAQATRLESINLSENLLTGAIGNVNWQQLTGLRTISLNDNSFGGSIPESLGLLTLLEAAFFQNNDLTGGLPGSFGQLEFLRELDLTGNAISGLPLLTSANNGALTSLLVSENNLAFGDIIPNLEVRVFEYIPQDSAGTRQSLTAAVRGTAVLQLDFDANVEGSRYEWFRQGGSVPVATTFENRLVLEDLSEDEFGDYYCRVTNPAVPNMQVYSRTITLQVGEDTGEGAYKVRSASLTCDAGQFSLRLDAIAEVSGVTAYEVNVYFPAERYESLGTVDFSESELVSDPDYAQVWLSDVSEPGRVRFLFVISASAPTDTRFSGQGQLLSMDFNILPGAEIGDETVISAEVEESYLVGFDDRPVGDGQINFVPQTRGRGRIVYEGAPMPYDAAAPDRYNLTEVTGVGLECEPFTSVRTPDLDGEFLFDLSESPSVRLTRDISGATAGDIALFINAADLEVIGNMIFENFTPAADRFPQFYKADVNGDGAVKPGDIFLLQRMIVQSLSDAEAAALAEAWTFADSEVLQGVEYTDFTIETVPQLPECVRLRNDLTVCEEGLIEISAFLRGDVDDSFVPDTENIGLRVSSVRSVTIDWGAAERDDADTTLWYAPVHFSDLSSTDSARSIDLIGQGVDSRLTVVGFEYPNRQVAASPSLFNSDFFPFHNFDQSAGTFRFTGFVTPGKRSLLPDSTFMRIGFRIPTGVALYEVDFGRFQTLVNGQLAETISILPAPVESTITDLPDETGGESFSLWPNPVTDGFLEVALPLSNSGSIAIYDTQGQQVLVRAFTHNEQSLRFDLSTLPEGLYLLRLSIGGKKHTRRFVKR